jgi:hypothetical protein
MLAERCDFQFHRETKELVVYAINLSRLTNRTLLGKTGLKRRLRLQAGMGTGRGNGFRHAVAFHGATPADWASAGIAARARGIHS